MQTNTINDELILALESLDAPANLTRKDAQLSVLSDRLREEGTLTLELAMEADRLSPSLDILSTYYTTMPRSKKYQIATERLDKDVVTVLVVIAAAFAAALYRLYRYLRGTDSRKNSHGGAMVYNAEMVSSLTIPTLTIKYAVPDRPADLEKTYKENVEKYRAFERCTLLTGEKYIWALVLDRHAAAAYFKLTAGELNPKSLSHIPRIIKKQVDRMSQYVRNNDSDDVGLFVPEYLKAAEPYISTDGTTAFDVIDAVMKNAVSSLPKELSVRETFDVVRSLGSFESKIKPSATAMSSVCGNLLSDFGDLKAAVDSYEKVLNAHHNLSPHATNLLSLAFTHVREFSTKTGRMMLIYDRVFKGYLNYFENGIQAADDVLRMSLVVHADDPKKIEEIKEKRVKLTEAGMSAP